MKILLSSEIHNRSLLKQRHGLTMPSCSAKTGQMMRRDHVSAEAKATHECQYKVRPLLTSIHRFRDQAVLNVFFCVKLYFGLGLL